MTYRHHELRFGGLWDLRKPVQLFVHDGHVQTFRTTDTIGSGTLASPKGMWTMTQGD